MQVKVDCKSKRECRDLFSDGEVDGEGEWLWILIGNFVKSLGSFAYRLALVLVARNQWLPIELGFGGVWKGEGSLFGQRHRQSLTSRMNLKTPVKLKCTSRYIHMIIHQI